MNPRAIASVVAIVAFLFAQLAVAAYACEMGMASNAVAGQQSHGDCCDPDGQAPDAVCHDHCQQASKAPERTFGFSLTTFVQAPLGAPLRVDTVGPPRSSPIRAPHLARHIEPPIAIRNCCFRI